MTTITSTTPKMRTITLTGRAPVRIDENKWPTIARASWDSFDGEDQARYTQARMRSELDECLIRVRENAKATKWIVYGTYSVADHNRESWSGVPAAGRIVTNRDDIPWAIAGVVRSLDAPPSLAAKCIANLPAVALG